ncbi:MAG: alpha/beta hydrolase [Steroidobacteraceae bacterium]
MQRLPRQERLTLGGPSGALEALAEEPERGASSGAGVVRGNLGATSDKSGAAGPGFGVICHPHPLHGGTLDNKVVYTLARALHDLGLPTVRFNFRGVGASEGRFADGRGETADALAVVAWGRARWPGAKPWLAGFSFGGGVALEAAAETRVERLITVAPAILRLEAAHAPPACPWLLIQGDADDVIDPGSVLAWASRQSPPPAMKVLAGAGHFFHGRLPELRAAVVEFAREAGAPEGSAG